MIYFIVFLFVIIVFFQVFLSFRYQGIGKAKKSSYLTYLDDLNNQEDIKVNCDNCNGEGYHYYDFTSSKESNYRVTICNKCNGYGILTLTPINTGNYDSYLDDIKQKKGRQATS